jgi:hypothetical protein
MSKFRPLSRKNKYYIPKEDYLTAIHYSLRYPVWKQEIDAIADTAKAIRYDKDNVQSSGDYDATFEAAVKLSESTIASKVKLIDDTISQVSKGMDNWIRLGVCYGLTFEQLKQKGMPCERDMYYDIRRHYYYELSKRI